MQYDVQDTVKDSRGAAWPISGVVDACTKRYFVESIIIIVIRIDQSLQDSLDAAPAAGNAPKTEADPIFTTGPKMFSPAQRLEVLKDQRRCNPYVTVHRYNSEGDLSR